MKTRLSAIFVALFAIVALFTVTASATMDIDAMTAQRISEINSTANTDISGVTGKVYYVSGNGDDSNDGLSPETAWKSLSRVQKQTFGADDAVLFERGSTFRGHLSVGYPLLLGSYGTGEKPRIYGSTNAAVSGSWSEVAENIWKYSNDTVYDIGNIVFDGDRDNEDAVFAHKVLTDTSVEYNDDNISTLLKSDLQFYSVGFAQSGWTNATALYLYSEINPNERFSQVELCEDCSIFAVQTDNVRVDNIEFRYGGGHGVNGGSLDGLTVSNCNFYWIGGGIHRFNGTEKVATRFGNAVELYGSAKNYTVTNNYICQVYDAGITPQYTTEKESVMENIRFADNVIEYCNYSIEYWNASTVDSSVIRNFVIENNIMRGAGQGLCTDRPDKYDAAHIKTWCNGTSSGYHKNIAENFVIRNNIMDSCDGQMIYLHSDDADSFPVLTGNTFIQAKNGGGITVEVTGDGNWNARPEYIPALINEQFPGNTLTYSDLDDTQTGTVGTVQWSLDLSTGELTIDGSGELNIDDENSVPWADFAEDIVSVTVGGNITNLGNYAFYGCDNIRSIDMPDAAICTSGTIGEVSWSYNTQTAELTVEGSGAIHDYDEYCTPWKAFAKGIKTITIGEDITAIGKYAFSGCTNLEQINFNAMNCANLAKDSTDGNIGTNYAFYLCGKNSDGITVIFGDNVTRVPSHLFRTSGNDADAPNVTQISFIGDRCTSLGDHCFRALSNLQSVALPESLKSIGTFAFGNCSSLTDVYIPSGVTYLGGFVFMNCRSLKTIHMPDAVTGSYNSCMFANCYSLESVVIPDGVTSLNDRMFRNCTSLTSVTIPSTVTKIGDYIFYGCTALNEIEIPASVTEITDKSIGYTGDTKNENLVIKCFSGTAGETYAKENGFSYIIMDHYGHTQTETVVTPAGCETEGIGEIRCSCGELIETITYPATGHTSNSGTITKAATCTTEGTKTYRCTKCSTVLKTESIAKLAHTEVTVPAVAPTCTKTGLTEGRKCSVCGTILQAQQTVDKISHSDSNNDGICDNCGAALAQSNPSANCSCNCHKSGFAGFIWKIQRFFYKLFGSHKYCSCGAAHY